MATFSSGSDYTPGEGISISSGGGGGGGDYNDPYEAELAAQKAAGGSGAVLGRGFDFSAGDGGDQPTLAELQAATAINTKLRQLAGTGSVPADIRNLNVRAGYMGNLANTPFSLEGLLGGQFSLSDLAKQSFQRHPIAQAFNYIGQNASRQLMEGLAKGYQPQYNAMGQVVATYDPETGRYGAGSVTGRIDPKDPRNQPVDLFPEDNGDPYIAPEATTIAAIEPEPEKSMIEQGYRYPAGGYYPEEGRFMRTGLLDIAPQVYGGLLAGYDPTQFGAMNVGFRQPTDVGLYQDPYDVSGYTLI